MPRAHDHPLRRTKAYQRVRPSDTTDEPAASADADARVDQTLRAARLRSTQARIAVLRTLQEFGGVPVDAVQIYRRLLEDGHTLLLPTVYNSLRRLVQGRLVVREVAGRERATYRLVG